MRYSSITLAYPNHKEWDMRYSSISIPPLKPESQSVSMHICPPFLTCSTVIR